LKKKKRARVDAAAVSLWEEEECVLQKAVPTKIVNRIILLGGGMRAKIHDPMVVWKRRQECRTTLFR